MMKLIVLSLNYVHVRKNWAPSSRKTQYPLRKPWWWWWCSSEEWPLCDVRIHRDKRGYRIWANCRLYECHSALRFKAAVLLLLILRRTRLLVTDRTASWHKHSACHEEVMTVSKSSGVMYAQFHWQADYVVQMTVSLLQHFAGRLHVGERLPLVGCRFPTNQLTN